MRLLKILGLFAGFCFFGLQATAQSEAKKKQYQNINKSSTTTQNTVNHNNKMTQEAEKPVDVKKVNYQQPINTPPQQYNIQPQNSMNPGTPDPVKKEKPKTVQPVKKTEIQLSPNQSDPPNVKKETFHRK